ncbi:hypothetical protein GC194_06185 [bacterium]|nr:hypothetical protein [bacterium]
MKQFRPWGLALLIYLLHVLSSFVLPAQSTLPVLYTSIIYLYLALLEIAFKALAGLEGLRKKAGLGYLFLIMSVLRLFISLAFLLVLFKQSGLDKKLVLFHFMAAYVAISLVFTSATVKELNEKSQS